MAKIAIVEDDRVLCSELARLLALQGYEPVACTDFPRAAAWLTAEAPDCAIIDLSLPGADGLSICRDFRRASSAPLMILTSSDNEFDEVMGMNLGADDFMNKPYRPQVLLAHVQALLRRAGVNESGKILACKGVSLDLAKGTVSYQGASAELTRNEQRILGVLMANPGQIVTRQELMCELWDTDAFVDDNTLTVNINRVRKLLAGLGVPEDFLTTKRGQGYLV